MSRRPCSARSTGALRCRRASTSPTSSPAATPFMARWTGFRRRCSTGSGSAGSSCGPARARIPGCTACWSGAEGSKRVPTGGAKASHWSIRRAELVRAFRPDRVRDAGEAVEGEQPAELAVDLLDQAGTVIDQGRVELDQARAGAEAVEGIDAVLDPAGGDQRQRAAGRSPEIAQPLERQRLQRL